MGMDDPVENMDLLAGRPDRGLLPEESSGPFSGRVLIVFFRSSPFKPGGTPYSRPIETTVPPWPGHPLQGAEGSESEAGKTR